MAEKKEVTKPNTIFQRFKDAMERIKKNRYVTKDDIKALLDAKTSDLNEFTKQKIQNAETKDQKINEKKNWQVYTGKTTFENLHKDDFTEIVSSEIWEWIKPVKQETGQDQGDGARGDDREEKQVDENDIKKEKEEE